MSQGTAGGCRSRLRWLVKYLLLILFGVVLNMVPAQLALTLKLPVYLDVIGTIVTGMTGGYLPGIFVGYATNLLKTFLLDSPDSIYYCAVNVLIAVLAARLREKEWFKSWWKTLLSVPLFALIGGFLGSLLTWVLYAFDFSEGISGNFARQIHQNLGFSPFWAQMSADYLIDIVDKLISVGAAQLIFRGIPAKIRDSFHYNYWLQNPMTLGEFRRAERFRPRKISLRTKILVLLIVSMTLIGTVTTVISFNSFRNELYITQKETGRSVTNIMKGCFDADRVEEYMTLGREAPGYAEVEKKLKNVLDSSHHIAYVYVYQIQEDGCHVVFDLDTLDLEASPPGTVMEFEEAFQPYLPDLLAGNPIDTIESDDSFGWLLTTYTPVADSSGKTVCYACTDISMDALRKDECRFLAKIISLFVSFTVLILAAFLWFSVYGVVLPINSMAMAAGNFAYNDEGELEEEANQIHNLGIRTGDEIENLYQAITKTTDDAVRYIHESREKNDVINRMQESLIITMADLVEDRDENTGDHIKKTAAYTQIIMEQLRKEGHYTDQLTDDYMKDVVRSAPLHDIGKIKIPDAILNKPGKLDEDEFNKMKMHTVYGGEIIEHTRAAAGEISYLGVAKDLATYHHERWDGRGYPSGLKGEEIPLSARIMAVADVFDALVSKRCYKEGFSFEKSMGIIREESGTHFDPLVAGAFLNAGDRVKEVMNAFSGEEA